VLSPHLIGGLGLQVSWYQKQRLDGQLLSPLNDEHLGGGGGNGGKGGVIPAKDCFAFEILEAP
jgi:hypothetical protein